MTTLTVDELYIKRCIELARLGKGKVAPNPMVGSVIVYNNQIIGEGYHMKYGGPHAEVNAINSVADKSVLSQSTIYVSLEPCAHYGKTPPCADLIIKHKIPKVVVGMQDPFAKVNGEGIKRIKKTGSKVIVGVLQDQCEDLNKPFITFHQKKRPHIILKWAQTSDGFIDKIRNKNDSQEPNWITNEVCRTLVHKWRAESQAILIGTNTALIDNPKLNVRSWIGNSPLRVVLDRALRLPQKLSIFDQSIPTIVINEKENKTDHNLEFIKVEFDNKLLDSILNILYKRDIQSLFIEGGQVTLQHFIDKNLWDEARVFTGKINFNEGIRSPNISQPATKQINIDKALLEIYIRNTK